MTLQDLIQQDRWDETMANVIAQQTADDESLPKELNALVEKYLFLTATAQDDISAAFIAEGIDLALCALTGYEMETLIEMAEAEIENTTTTTGEVA